LTLWGRLHVVYSLYASLTRARRDSPAVSSLAKELYKLYTTQSIFNKFEKKIFTRFPCFVIEKWSNCLSFSGIAAI